jgi:hypothetical protein
VLVALDGEPQGTAQIAQLVHADVAEFGAAEPQMVVGQVMATNPAAPVRIPSGFPAQLQIPPLNPRGRIQR